MKYIERQTVGQSVKVLHEFVQSVLYPSPSLNSMVPVKGVCFATGQSSNIFIDRYLRRYMGFGVFGLYMKYVSSEVWMSMNTFLVGDHASGSSVALLLENYDLTSPTIMPMVAETIDTVDTVAWFATAESPESLCSQISLPFLIYAGLGSRGQMRFALQEEQSLRIDSGSLNRKS